MSQDTKIEISIDPSLLNHFIEHQSKKKSRLPPEDAIAGLITTILDNSAYLIKAKQQVKER